MRRRNKKWMAMILTAAFVFSGGLATAPKAFADDDEEGYVSTFKAPFNMSQFTADWQKYLIINTSIIADKDYIEINDILDGGGTLIEASGMNGAKLFDGLRTKLEQNIQSASQTYLIDEKQLSELRASLLSQTQSAINTPGFKPQTESKSSFDFKTILNGRLSGLSSAASSFSSEDYIDVEDRLLAGESIVEATRMDTTVLLNNLLPSINEQIQDALNSGIISTAKADEYRNQAREAISSAIMAPGGVKLGDDAAASKTETEAFIKEKLQSIATVAYLVSGLEDDDIDYQEAFKNGASLARLTGLSVDDLANRIAKTWEQDIDAWSVSGKMTSKEKEALQQQVLTQIKAALSH